MAELGNQLDTHCHLSQYPAPVELRARLTDDQSPTIIAVSLSPRDWQRTCELAAGQPRIFPAIGLIPQEIDRHRDQIPDLIAAIPETRFIGEIGLDYVTDDPDNRRRQHQLFSRILETCAQFDDRILTIHSRRAADDVVAAIGPNFPGRTVLHWYSGPLHHVENAANCLWFSVNTAMAASRSGRKIIAAIPPDRLLLETDGPYVKVGDRPASPFDLHLVLERLAAIRNWPLEETRLRLATNAARLLGRSSE